MDDDDLFNDDTAAFTAAVEAAERSFSSPAPAPLRPTNNNDNNSTTTAGSSNPKVQQPKPQALPSRSTGSSILVSPRQKGNPVLNSIRSLPWEYADIPADYILGSTTCALYLSLKYHRLHPEYIYSRIRALAGKYNLRVLLASVDIGNHEDPLKELAKTSLVNNLTLILCWTPQEAARYLELYKSFEHAAPTAIRAQQATSYAEKMVEFVTGPRSINKTDAVGLVSSFGSLRAAIAARPEEIAMIAGWGEKKVQRWSKTVREGFRVKKTAAVGASSRRPGVGVGNISSGNSSRLISRDQTMDDNDHDDGGDDSPVPVVGAPIPPVPIPIGSIRSHQTTQASPSKTPDIISARATPNPQTSKATPPIKTSASSSKMAGDGDDEDDGTLGMDIDPDEEEALLAAEALASAPTTQSQGQSSSSQPSRRQGEDPDEMNAGIMAALARLRKDGGGSREERE
ncbi:MAG: hypothetical protein M1819_000083 [Sarea resinae]|nr:MAG: hypothetical protein M1819_000083 [Sarea resinae]